MRTLLTALCIMIMTIPVFGQRQVRSADDAIRDAHVTNGHALANANRLIRIETEDSLSYKQSDTLTTVLHLDYFNPQGFFRAYVTGDTDGMHSKGKLPKVKTWYEIYLKPDSIFHTGGLFPPVITLWDSAIGRFWTGDTLLDSTITITLADCVLVHTTIDSGAWNNSDTSSTAFRTGRKLFTKQGVIIQ